MAATIENSAEGASGVAATTATFGFTATAGRLLVLAVAAGATKSADPTGYTLSTGMSGVDFLGSYVWWRVATGGETSVEYTIGSAIGSAWQVLEISGLEASPFDTSVAAEHEHGTGAYESAALTPTAGERLVLVMMSASIGGGGNTGAFTNWTGFTNSFALSPLGVIDSGVAGPADRHAVNIATREVTADGITAFSTAATAGTHTPQCGYSHAIAFKVAAGADPVTGTSAVTLAPPTSAGTGAHGVTGTATSTIAAPSSTVSGVHGVAGTSTAVLAAPTSTGVGMFGDQNPGTELREVTTGARPDRTTSTPRPSATTSSRRRST